MLARSRAQLARVLAIAAAAWTCAGDPTAEGVGTPFLIQPDFDTLKVNVGTSGLLTGTVLDARANRLQAPITFTACNSAVATVAVDTSYHPVPATSMRAVVTSVPPAGTTCVVLSSSGLKPETVSVVIRKGTPTVTTSPVPPPPDSGVVGQTIGDTARIVGGFAPLSGTVTFTLFDPSAATCTVAGPNPRYTEVVTVTGAGAYGVPGFVADTDGVWHWRAAYSGDANNAAVTTTCASGAHIVKP